MGETMNIELLRELNDLLDKLDGVNRKIKDIAEFEATTEGFESLHQTDVTLYSNTKAVPSVSLTFNSQETKTLKRTIRDLLVNEKREMLATLEQHGIDFTK
jgi:hypothetical protein